jgi:hypothetical protein
MRCGRRAAVAARNVTSVSVCAQEKQKFNADDDGSRAKKRKVEVDVDGSVRAVLGLMHKAYLDDKVRGPRARRWCARGALTRSGTPTYRRL